MFYFNNLCTRFPLNANVYLFVSFGKAQSYSIFKYVTTAAATKEVQNIKLDFLYFSEFTLEDISLNS